MRKSFRTAVLAAVGAGALLAASSASAAFTTSPRLFASQPDQPNRVDLLYTQSVAEDPVAKIVHHVPQPYRVNLNARPLNTLVGVAVLRGNPIDRVGRSAPNANLVLSGDVTVTTAQQQYRINNRMVRMSQAATACLGKPVGERGMYWLAQLKDAGGDVMYHIPIFVERLSAVTPFQADATISVCFMAPDLPSGNANRAPVGFRVREFDLRLTRVFTTPRIGQLTWSTIAFPYTPRTGRLNTGGAVELQSHVTYPRTVGLANPVRTRLTSGFATYRFGGRVSVPALDQPRVSLFRGANRTQAGSPSAQAYPIKTGGGTYTKTHTIRRVPGVTQTFFFQVRAYVANQIQGRTGCRANFHPNITCIQSTRAGYMIRSRTVQVTVPKR